MGIHKPLPMHKQIYASLAMALVIVAAPALTVNQNDGNPQVYLSSEDVPSDAGFVVEEQPYMVGEDECLIYYSDGYIEQKPECGGTEGSHQEVYVMDEDECHIYHSDGMVELKDECEDDQWDDWDDDHDDWDDDDHHQDVYVVDEDECYIYHSDGYMETKDECDEDGGYIPHHDDEDEPAVAMIDEDECHYYFEDGYVELKPECEDDGTHVDEDDHQDVHVVDEDECYIYHSDGFVELKEECGGEDHHEDDHQDEGPQYEIVDEDECHYYFEDGYVELKPECAEHKDYDQYDVDFDDHYEDHYHSQVDELKWMAEEIEMRIHDLRRFIGELDAMREGNERVDQKIRDLEEVADKAEEILEKIREAAEEGDLEGDWERIDEFWMAIDQINRAAQFHMDTVAHAFEMEHDIHFVEEYDRDGAEAAWDEKYGEHDFKLLEDKIDYDMMDQIVRHIPEEMMGQMMEHMHHDQGAHMMTHLMNNMDVLDDKATQMMEYSIELMSVMEEVEIDDEDNPRYDRLKELFEESMTYLSEDTHEDIINFWLRVRDAVVDGASDEELAAFETEIMSHLEANQQALVDEGVQFHDVLLGNDDWYFDPVIELKNRGVIDGKQGGVYDPGADITNSEILKVLLESADIGAATHAPQDTTAHGHWYEGYVAQAEELGLDLPQNWDEAASRGDVAVWASQIFELHEDVDGDHVPFGDVDQYDPNANHYQAVYDHGIFTGAGDTGHLNPDDPINRAESAQVALMIIENVVEVQSLDGLSL